MKNENSKNPFVGFTEEEAKELEAKFFTISTGKDFLHDENGAFIFTENMAQAYKRKAIAGLRKLVKEGNSRNKQEAIDAICSLNVFPVKIQ